MILKCTNVPNRIFSHLLQFVRSKYDRFSDIGIDESMDLLLALFTLQDSGEAERLESVAQSLVEFAHEFDPANEIKSSVN